jgi:hypothetical protein
MRLRKFGIWGVAGVWAFSRLIVPATAQENLDHGKTAAQIFASDCAICHKSPNGLGKAGGPFGLDSFLRVHYTASKESATALAKYLAAFADAPEPGGKTTKRSAKGSDKKPAEAKSAKDKSAKDKDGKPTEAKAAPKDEPNKEMNETPKEEPKSESKSEAKPEPKAEVKPEPKSEPKGESKPEKSD